MKKRLFVGALIPLMLMVGVDGLLPARAVASTGNLSTPSWWNGDCDSGGFPGSFRLGATYRGMPACGPLKSTHLQSKFPGWGMLEWQCVELSMRYLYLAFGQKGYAANGSTVVSNYPGSALTRINNNGKGPWPISGDVMSWGATTSNGHTNVVTSTSYDSSGNGTIYLIEQNASSSGATSVKIVNGVVQSLYGYSSGGWLHNPTLTWTVRTSNNQVGGTPSTFTSALQGIPIVGDWTASGRDMPGVVTTTSDGLLQWNLWTTSTSGNPNVVFKYGSSADLPVVGDWDGNGTDTPAAVHKGTNGYLQWNERSSNSSTASTVSFEFGHVGDTPLAGLWHDWTGARFDSPVAVSNNPDGYLGWAERSSNDTNLANVSVNNFEYGHVGDTPVIGNWNADPWATETPGAVHKNPSGYLQWNERSNNTGSLYQGTATTNYFEYGTVDQYPVVGKWPGLAANYDTPGVVDGLS